MRSIAVAPFEHDAKIAQVHVDSGILDASHSAQRESREQRAMTRKATTAAVAGGRGWRGTEGKAGQSGCCCRTAARGAAGVRWRTDACWRHVTRRSVSSRRRACSESVPSPTASSASPPLSLPALHQQCPNPLTHPHPHPPGLARRPFKATAGGLTDAADGAGRSVGGAAGAAAPAGKDAAHATRVRPAKSPSACAAQTLPKCLTVNRLRRRSIRSAAQTPPTHTRRARHMRFHVTSIDGSTVLTQTRRAQQTRSSLLPPSRS